MNKELEEAVKILNEMRDNCLNKKEYNDKARYDKAEAISTILDYIDNSISKEAIEEKLMKYFDINTNNCMAYNLTRVKEAKQYGTLTIDDFVEFDEETINDIVNYIFKK